MGKIKGTSEAIRFKDLFDSKKHPLFAAAFKTGSGRELENQFPLNMLSKDQQDHRKELWKELRTLSGPKAEQTVKYCKAAISAFSKLLVPYSFLSKEKKEHSITHATEDRLRELEQQIDIFRRACDIAQYPKTRMQIEREIRMLLTEAINVNMKLERITNNGGAEIHHSVEGVFRLYSTLLKVCQFPIEQIHPRTVMNIMPFIKNSFMEYHEFKLGRGHKTEDYPLPLQALVLTLYEALWKASGLQTRSAQLTADLCNEYLRTEFTEIPFLDTKKIINFRKSMCRDGEYQDHKLV